MVSEYCSSTHCHGGIYWSQHNPIIEILFLPPCYGPPWQSPCTAPTPMGWRKITFALCGVTEPWCSGSRISAAMPGLVRIRSRKISLNGMFTRIVLVFLNNCKDTAVVSVLLVWVTITASVNQKTMTRKVAEW